MILKSNLLNADICEWINKIYQQKCGRFDEEIGLLKQKLRVIYRGEAFNGKPTKTARSHGKKFQVSVKQETAKILVRNN